MRFYFTIFFTLCVFSTFSQGVTMEWQKCFGGSQYETARTMVATGNGILIIGSTNSSDGDLSQVPGTSFPNGAPWLIMTDLQGNITWQKILGGNGQNHINTALKTADGNIILVGFTSSNGGTLANHGSADYWVVKISPAGNILWQKCYGGSMVDDAQTAIILSDGNILVAGSSNSSDGDITVNKGDYDIWLVKIDQQNGNLLAQKSYGGSMNDGSPNIAQDGQRLIVSATPAAFDNDWGGPATWPANTTILFYTDLSLNRLPGQQVYPSTYSVITQRHPLTGDLFYALDSNRCTSTGIFHSLRLEGTGFAYDFPYTCPITPQGPVTTTMSYGNKYFQLSSEYIPQVCGYTNDTTGGLLHRGNYDAFFAEKPTGNSLVLSNTFGGSKTEIFLKIIDIDAYSCIALGHTQSTDGDVTGNHGQQDIWLVKLKKSRNAVYGHTFIDLNGNGFKENNEPYYNQALVKTEKPGFSITSYTSTGSFSNFTDTGHYITAALPTSGYYTASPVTHNSSFTQYAAYDSFDIAFSPVPGIKDLHIKMIPLTPVRPGVQSHYMLVFGNKGTAPVNNTSVQLCKNAKFIFAGATLPGAVVTGDTITWQTGLLNPLQYDTIQVTLQNNVANLFTMGQTIETAATIFPVTGDQAPADNNASVKQVVTASFDPNDKTEHHGGTITANDVQNGEPLKYTIRFQNTGTDTAFVVRITDTLDARLDAATFRQIVSSHPCTVSIKEGKYITYSFSNIILPDSGTNGPASHGFCSFEINMRPGAVAAGDTLKNTAHIYFDFNEAVITNTAKTTVINGTEPYFNVTGSYCINAGNQTGHVMNQGSNTISVFLDNNPLVYNPADSSLHFNVGNLLPGNHQLKLEFTNPGGTGAVLRWITIEDLIRPVIGNNDTAVCVQGSAFALRSDIPVTWSGNGVSASSFSPAIAGVGTHRVIATKRNNLCPDGKDTLTITVLPLLTPDVNLTASQSNIGSVTQNSVLTAVNVLAGGTAPLYTFARDRNFTQLLGSESAVNTFTIIPQMLNTGANIIYVRMRSNAGCVTGAIAIDSVSVTLNATTPTKTELEQALKIMPNPGNGLFTFRFETGINDAVSITVYDAAGKEVFGKAYGSVNQYYFSRSLDLRNRHGGTYTIQFRIGSTVIIRRVSIAR